MLLLEADGKQLFRQAGIAVPDGVRLRSADAAELARVPGPGPWIVKAQVPVGGRGKAGGIRRVSERSALAATVRAVLGSSIKGCLTEEVLVEAPVDGAEHYLSLMVDPTAGAIRLMFSPQGGIDIEAHGAVDETGTGFNQVAPLEPKALEAMASRLIESAPPAHRAGLAVLMQRLLALFLDKQLLLAEINPLFARADGSYVAGDAKVVIDMNVVHRHDDLLALISERRDLYADAWRKVSEDFDFVEVDAHGDVGLVTTGAGLSMMLIDEMAARGLRPFNFCDMRTGQMRGSPARLLRVLDWITAAPDVKVVLVNIFAGITDLAEFAQLLVQALDERPDFRLPMVVRLVGNGEAAAAELLSARADPRITIEPDLDRAIECCAQLLQRMRPHEGSSHAV